MSSENKNISSFEELTWNDLQSWAGEKATAKGIKYQEEGKVKEISFTPKGNLVARVEGSKEYFTEVSLVNGKLNSLCTCSVGFDCKHGVAALLDYLEHVELGEEIPVIAEEDPLIEKVRMKPREPDSSRTYNSGDNSLHNLHKYLENLEKQELIEILIKFAQKDSELCRYLRNRQNRDLKM